jgi:hypothetical protein
LSKAKRGKVLPKNEAERIITMEVVVAVTAIIIMVAAVVVAAAIEKSGEIMEMIARVVDTREEVVAVIEIEAVIDGLLQIEDLVRREILKLVAVAVVAIENIDVILQNLSKMNLYHWVLKLI